MLGNFLTAVVWGLALLAVRLLPLLTVALPVLAYASFALYRKVFPLAARLKFPPESA